jgi:hypothetical protein
VRTLFQDDKAFRVGIVDTLRQYNMEQLVTADYDKEAFIVSAYNHLGEDKYVDTRHGKTFDFDHMRQVSFGGEGDVL